MLLTRSRLKFRALTRVSIKFLFPFSSPKFFYSCVWFWIFLARLRGGKLCWTDVHLSCSFFSTELRKGAPAACCHQNWSSNVCPANVKLQEVARTEWWFLRSQPEAGISYSLEHNENNSQSVSQHFLVLEPSVDVMASLSLGSYPSLRRRAVETPKSIWDQIVW